MTCYVVTILHPERGHPLLKQIVSMYKGYSKSYCMLCVLAKLKFNRNHTIRAALLYVVCMHGSLKEITVMNTIQWHRNHGGNTP